MRFRESWERFWFRPAHPDGLLVCRAAVCINSLWIVASRPDLPEVLRWPAGFWNHVNPALRGRFLLFSMPAQVETALYGLLVLSLIAATFGTLHRASCFISALLLYRFGALESVLTVQSGPHFRGLTVPVVILLLMAFTNVPQFHAAPSSEFRWPLMLARILVANIYVASGIAKLWNVGPVWFTGGYFRSLVYSMSLPEFTPPWAHVWATSPLFGWLGAIGAFVLDFAIVVPIFFPRTSWVVIPLLILGHLFIWKIFGVIFLSVPLLILFLPSEEGHRGAFGSGLEPQSVDDRRLSV